MEERKLYIAYGSNLNLEQMARRCPGASVVGSTFIEGYRLLFRGALHGAVATIEPCRGRKVPVLIWSISRRNEKALDAYEGWPRLYRKQVMKVNLDGRKVSAMVYLINYGMLGKPGNLYYNVIADGYRSAGFDLAYLEKGVEDSCPVIEGNEISI